jgi:nitrite reductase/ring-hydroxylating ferredoxin subunit
MYALFATLRRRGMGLLKRWVEIGKESEFADSDRKQAFVDGKDILVLKVDGRYYAIHNVCTHAFALMVGGIVEGYEIECPLHGARFDIRTGRNLTPPAVRGLAVYDTKVTDGAILVRI